MDQQLKQYSNPNGPDSFITNKAAADLLIGSRFIVLNYRFPIA
jgi:hypothetical protein